jgi:hypothetical protein
MPSVFTARDKYIRPRPMRLCTTPAAVIVAFSEKIAKFKTELTQRSTIAALFVEEEEAFAQDMALRKISSVRQ